MVVTEAQTGHVDFLQPPPDGVAEASVSETEGSHGAFRPAEAPDGIRNDTKGPSEIPRATEIQDPERAETIQQDEGGRRKSGAGTGTRDGITVAHARRRRASSGITRIGKTHAGLVVDRVGYPDADRDVGITKTGKW